MTHQNSHPCPKTVLSLAALALGGFITGGLLYAGPLNPPAGAVAPTHKTLTEVEPRTAINATNTPGDADSLFKITQPGSYYLTGNITGVVGKHGIEIAASGVTLDLNGFDLVGVPAMGAFDGVSVTVNNLTNIAVLNGSVRNWGGEGVDVGTFGAVNGRVEGVRASGNTVHGINVGAGSTVSNCSTYFNSSIGINTGVSCTVTNCTAYSNVGNGITVVQGSTVEGCTVRSNTIDGIWCSASCVIRGNTCSFNGNAGGDGAGIRATGTDNRIEGNNCTNADRGIDVDGTGNIIIRNTCSGNTNSWDVVAGNVILVVNATTAAAVTGNSGGTAPGSTDPNANFTY